MNPDDYIKKIETEVLQIIKAKLESHQIDSVRAQEISKYVLSALHPHMTMDQIREAVENFDEHFSELIPVVVDVTKEYNEKVKNSVINYVHDFLQRGKIDEANVLLTKTINKQVKIKE